MRGCCVALPRLHALALNISAYRRFVSHSVASLVPACSTTASCSRKLACSAVCHSCRLTRLCDRCCRRRRVHLGVQQGLWPPSQLLLASLPAHWLRWLVAEGVAGGAPAQGGEPQLQPLRSPLFPCVLQPGRGERKTLLKDTYQAVPVQRAAPRNAFMPPLPQGGLHAGA